MLSRLALLHALEPVVTRTQATAAPIRIDLTEAQWDALNWVWAQINLDFAVEEIRYFETRKETR